MYIFDVLSEQPADDHATTFYILHSIMRSFFFLWPAVDFSARSPDVLLCNLLIRAVGVFCVECEC